MRIIISGGKKARLALKLPIEQKIRVIGFPLWNATGKSVWSHDAVMKDHTDYRATVSLPGWKQ